MSSSELYADNPVLCALYTRRSIRFFNSEPVTKQAVEAVLEAGRWSPSALNRQPCRFVVIGPNDPRKHRLAAQTIDSDIVRGCQVLFGVLLERKFMKDERKDYQSAGACLQNMLLACHGLGLGAVWLGEILNQEKEVLHVLGRAPEDYELMAFLAVGHPAEEGHSLRNDLSRYLLEPLPADL